MPTECEKARPAGRLRRRVVAALERVVQRADARVARLDPDDPFRLGWEEGARLFEDRPDPVPSPFIPDLTDDEADAFQRAIDEC